MASQGADILAGRPQIIRVLQPRPKDGALAADASTAVSNDKPAQPQRLPATSAAVDILSLAPTDGRTPSDGTASAAAGGVRLVSGEEKRSEQAVAAVPQGYFGYDPQYGWLRGRLEYSQVDQRWKLRYIPIDGTSDQYGGSVILPDAKLLSGYERGDFVEVHGQLGRPDSRKPNLAPSYQVAEIKRIAPSKPAAP